MEPRRWSVRVGRIAGIDIRIHASMLLLVWIVVASAGEVEGSVAAGLLWVTAIFGGVLLHEFSHSLTARHFGVVVREIELLPIGGVSKFDTIPDAPRQELLISLAGPTASLVIGLTALIGITAVNGGLPAPALAGGPFWTRVAWFNIVIGLFNLLPALPLDGGRVLRAVFEMREGPLQATHHAARLGRVIALAMIFFGVFSGQIFVAIIGVFVSVVSRAEEVSAEIQDGMAHLSAADVMVRLVDTPAVQSSTRLDQCPPLAPGRALPVVDESGRVVGLLYAEDMMRAAARRTTIAG
jgi:Zn-dependent protease